MKQTFPRANARDDAILLPFFLIERFFFLSWKNRDTFSFFSTLQLPDRRPYFLHKTWWTKDLIRINLIKRFKYLINVFYVPK